MDRHRTNDIAYHTIFSLEGIKLLVSYQLSRVHIHHVRPIMIDGTRAAFTLSNCVNMTLFHVIFYGFSTQSTTAIRCWKLKHRICKILFVTYHVTIDLLGIF